MMTKEEIALHFAEHSVCDSVPVVPSICQTSLFSFHRYEAISSAFENAQIEPFIYSRDGNPTVNLLEQKIAALESGQEACCFASGMGAISAVLQTLTKSGDHILLLNQLYGPTVQFVNQLQKYNITHTCCKQTDLQSIENCIQPNTKLIYMESPGTMTFRFLDVQAVAKLARQRGILTAIDNTWATPIFFNPLTVGIDIVVHSLTKYINGHSDLLGGAVIGDHEKIQRIRHEYLQLNGCIMAPFTAWLILRGARTLSVRMQQHMQNTKKVVRFLQTHPRVQQVNHPLAYDAETKQAYDELFCGYSGLLSFELSDANFQTVTAFLNALQIFRIGVSWGGYESLAISLSRQTNAEVLLKDEISPGLVRLSVGLEPVEMLIQDLERAFDALRCN